MRTTDGKLMLTVPRGLCGVEAPSYPRLHQRGSGVDDGARRENGGKPKFTRHQQAEAIKRRNKDETLTEIARSYNVSHTTISRLGT